MKKCSKCGRIGLFFFIDTDGYCEKCAVKVKQQQEIDRKHQLELERERQLADAHVFIGSLASACVDIPASTPLRSRANSEEFSLWLEQLSLEEMVSIEAACEKICTLAKQRYNYPLFKEAFLAECTPVDGISGYVRHPAICTDIISTKWGDLGSIFVDFVSNVESLGNQVRLAKNFESIKYKVVGVTFKNGRRSRQTILRQIRFQDPPYSKEPEIRIEEYEYEGEPAFAVYANEEQVGNIGKDDIPELLVRWDRYRRVKRFSIHGGGDFNYGMEICVEFYR